MVTLNHSNANANAKAKLLELIRGAHADQLVLIIDHSLPVARIFPYPPKETAMLDERLLSFERSRFLHVGPDDPTTSWPPARPRHGALKRFTRDR
jgi:antitoxin (DNA-binding transcriptional repressor) of toxin-antitoxin stability system